MICMTVPLNNYATDYSFRIEKTKNKKNYCSRLYEEERKNFFNKLNTSFVSDNRFLCEGNHSGNIKLVEDINFYKMKLKLQKN